MRAGPALVTVSAAALAVGFVIQVGAQQRTASKAPLVFDVASVKPTPADDHRHFVVRPGIGNQTYLVIDAPLRDILCVAYEVTDRQISGGPAWLGGAPWNIDAKAEGAGISDELHAALARLIEERFPRDRPQPPAAGPATTRQ